MLKILHKLTGTIFWNGITWLGGSLCAFYGDNQSVLTHLDTERTAIILISLKKSKTSNVHNSVSIPKLSKCTKIFNNTFSWHLRSSPASKSSSLHTNHSEICDPRVRSPENWEWRTTCYDSEVDSTNFAASSSCSWKTVTCWWKTGCLLKLICWTLLEIGKIVVPYLIRIPDQQDRDQKVAWLYDAAMVVHEEKSSSED